MNERLFDIFDFFWPWLVRWTSEQRAKQADRTKADLQRIASIDFKRDSSAALDEARRLADSEADRRRGTEQKAATYLPLVAALIPLILTVVSALWEKKAGGAPIWLNLLLLGLAVSYTAAAGVWAFRVFEVSMSHEVGVGDFVYSWGKRNPVAAQAARLLSHARRNMAVVDWKVTCIMMAHKFLLRAFLAFSLLLILNILWYLIAQMLLTEPVRGGVLETPRQAVAAVTRIDRLAGRMKAEAAWTTLADECRIRPKGHTTVQYVAGPDPVPGSMPNGLKPVAGEPVLAREVRIDCSGRTMAKVRSWTVLKRLGGSATISGLIGPPPGSAPPKVLSVDQVWPGQRADPEKLPKTLIRQVVAIPGRDGQAAALVVTEIGPSILDLR
ncbi:hypothetical protein [Sphingomonas parapaucimobilis]|uniref:Uncharacterized protein n=1 Tax=Sphingomonas parapaucimobilis NBRC 15100 TaxID=1219049 RepID=A0A0A1W8T1_9SPHN|nr:hypothetical protein [Sphingomonas parapaucimobilis]GAM01592.1 hypothetical protein SP5_067_00050 [Sphingomonas parapaucimobilis NBRC 15100]